MEKNPWKKFLKVFVWLALIVGGMYGAAVLTEALRRAGVVPKAMGIGFLVVWFLGGAIAVFIWKIRKNRQ